MKPFAFALAFLALASPAAASWQPADPVSGPNSSNTQPDVAVNARGDSATAWVRKGMPPSAQLSVRDAGGAWLPAKTLPGGAVAGEPRVAIDGSGHAYVVWAATAGGKQPIWVVTADAAGVSAPVDLTGGASGGDPVIAVNERGDAVAAWVAFNGVGQTALAAVRPAGGAWSQPKQLSGGVNDMVEDPDVAIAEDGRAVVTWQLDDSIEAAFHTPKTGWSSTKTVEGGNPVVGGFAPRAGIDANGNATVVWGRFGIGLPFPGVRASEGSAAAGWKQPVDLQDEAAIDADVAVRPGGAVVAAWARNAGGHIVIETASRPAPGGTWSTPTVRSDPAHDSSTPSVALDPHGDAVVVWDQKVVIGHVPYAATSPAGSPDWSAQHALAGPASGASTPRVAIDSAGDAVAAFARGNAIVAASFDAAPALSVVHVPASGRVGEPLAFSASASDLWSPVGIAWSFGDGAVVTGAQASHSYAAVGDFVVTVTATDAAGNSSSEKHTVHVSAAAVGEPGAPAAGGPAAGEPGAGIPPEPPTRAVAFRGLKIKRQTIVVRHRVALVRATCPVGTCRGTLRLMAGHKTLGRARFSVASGKTVRIRVRVTRVGAVRVTALAHDAAGATRTTRARLRLVSPHGSARHGRRQRHA